MKNIGGVSSKPQIAPRFKAGCFGLRRGRQSPITQRARSTLFVNSELLSEGGFLRADGIEQVLTPQVN